MFAHRFAGIGWIVINTLSGNLISFVYKSPITYTIQKEGAALHGLGRALASPGKAAGDRDDRGTITGGYVPHLVFFRVCCSSSSPQRIPISGIRTPRKDVLIRRTLKKGSKPCENSKKYSFKVQHSKSQLKPFDPKAASRRLVVSRGSQGRMELSGVLPNRSPYMGSCQNYGPFLGNPKQ